MEDMIGKHRICSLRPAEGHWEKNWEIDSIPDFFKEPEKYLAQIPESERLNLHVTIAKTVEKRELYSQDILIFDIDDIEIDLIEQYLPPIASGISENATLDNVGFVSSGHGIHAYVKLKQPIEEENTYKDLRKLYHFICKRIELCMEEAGLVGKVDRGIFSNSHLIRLPGTINRKEDKEDSLVEILTNNIELEIDLLLEASAACFLVDDSEFISEKSLTRMPPIDGQAVIDGCKFIEYCRYNQEEVDEPQWYAMLTLVSRIDEKLCHEFSQEHSKYRYKATELKIEQALNNAGPRTCENICGLWEGCEDCEHYGNIVSPITIKSPEFIATEKTGFRVVSEKKDTKDVLAYKDLIKFFERQHPFVYATDSGAIHIWKDNHWQPTDAKYKYIEKFVLEHVMPEPTPYERKEVVSRMTCQNHVTTAFFSVGRKLNCANGVLDLDTNELLPHSPTFGFQNVLPYPYDVDAKAPRFEQFLDEVTKNRKDLRAILEEFGGYAFSGVCPSLGERALILLGEGSNGKSVYLDTIGDLVSEEASCSLMMSDLSNEYNLDMLNGKLFNISEETPKKSLLDGSSFKNLITGGRVNARRPYGLPYTYKNRAKFIFACNRLPKNLDATHGMMRRLIIIPFDVKFDKHAGNRDARLREKLTLEASGILNIFIRGYQRFIEQGEFTDSSVVDREVEIYREETDTVLAWFKANSEWTGNHDDNFHAIKELYHHYSNWCIAENLHREMEQGSNTFSKRLMLIHPEITRVRKIIEGSQQRVVTGFKVEGLVTF